MTNHIKEVTINQAYAGGVKLRAIADNGEVFVLETEHAKQILLNALNQEHTTELKPRQQYARITVPSL